MLTQSHEDTKKEAFFLLGFRLFEVSNDVGDLLRRECFGEWWHERGVEPLDGL